MNSNFFRAFVALLFFVFFIRALRARSRFAPIALPLKVREDPAGSGYFGTPRIGHAHQGVDFLAVPDQSIFSPISGKVIRSAQPYPDDSTFSGLVISNEVFEVKIFYVLGVLPFGSEVKKGQLIGYAQNVAAKYGGEMKNHVHLEIRENGSIQNPINFF
jgi:murein DD-endopeptidase MepM/ murein hydrolase activator NlpD